MITFIAYLLTFITVLVTGSLVGMVFMMVFRSSFIRADNPAFTAYVNFLDNVVSRIAGIWLSFAIFRWLGITFSAIALILPIALYCIQDVNRISLYWNSQRGLPELGWGFGDLVGFTVGYFLVVNHVQVSIKLWLGLVLLAPLLYMYFTSKTANYEFWNLVAKFPDEAHAWFMTDGCWYFDADSAKKQTKDVEGPFLLAVPSLNSTIWIWADAQRISNSQRRFVEKYKS